MNAHHTLTIISTFFAFHLFTQAADRKETPHLDVREFLAQAIEPDAVPNLDAAGLMLRAAAEGNLQLAQALIRLGVAPNTPGEQQVTPLDQAIRHNRRAFVELLGLAGVDLNAPLGNGYSPIRYATLLGHVDILQFLLPSLDPFAIFELDADGNTLLHTAATTADPRVFLLFFLNGLPVDSVNRMGRTALHLAVLHGQVEVIRVLRVLGANVHAQDQGGRTPLALARTVRNVAAHNALTELLDVNLVLQPYFQFMMENAPRVAAPVVLEPSCDQPIKRRKSDDPEDEGRRDDKRFRQAPNRHPIASWGPPLS